MLNLSNLFIGHIDNFQATNHIKYVHNIIYTNFFIFQSFMHLLIIWVPFALKFHTDYNL